MRQTYAGSLRMNPRSMVVWERVLESNFILGFIINFILKISSKTLHTLVVSCPRTPWIPKRLPNTCSEETEKKLFTALTALLASQQSSAAKAVVIDLNGSVDKYP